MVEKNVEFVKEAQQTEERKQGGSPYPHDQNQSQSEKEGNLGRRGATELTEEGGEVQRWVGRQQVVNCGGEGRGDRAGSGRFQGFRQLTPPGGAGRGSDRGTGEVTRGDGGRRTIDAFLEERENGGI